MKGVSSLFRINVKYKSAHNISPSNVPVLRLLCLLKEVGYYSRGVHRNRKNAELMIVDPAPYLVSSGLYNIYGTNKRVKFLQ